MGRKVSTGPKWKKPGSEGHPYPAGEAYSAGRIDKRLTYPQGSGWDEPAWTAAYDDDNRLATLATVTLIYDLDGNLRGSRLHDGPWSVDGVSSGNSGAFTWNARNQLTRVFRHDNSQQVDYTYDAEGNLISQTDSAEGTTRWIIDPHGGPRSRVLAKVAPNGVVTRYIYGGGLLYEVRQDGRIRYYHYDNLGSTIALTNAAGAVVGRADYTPYGALQGPSVELAAADKTPFLFVGAHGVITDPATGLHHMRARWYSSHLRRFLSEDPLGLAAGPNVYAYCNGDPISDIDPSGLGYWSDVGKVWGGYWDTVAGTAQGLFNVVAHPVNTGKGVYYAATNPGQTFRAIKQATITSWESGPRGQERVVGEVLLAAATLATGGTTGAAKVGGGTYKFADLMAESGQTSKTMARIYYEIGQKTLAEAPKVSNPIIRGAQMVEELGWPRAVMPTWRGLLFGAGTTFGTGPTTAGWLGASGLILGAKTNQLLDSGYLSPSSGGSVSTK